MKKVQNFNFGLAAPCMHTVWRSCFGIAFILSNADRKADTDVFLRMEASITCSPSTKNSHVISGADALLLLFHPPAIRFATHDPPPPLPPPTVVAQHALAPVLEARRLRFLPDI
jgi:hypothetical protein